jgi:hypothetical protein
MSRGVADSLLKCLAQIVTCATFSSVTHNGLLVGVHDPNPGNAAFFTNNVQTTMRFNGNIVRVGLNYQFH